MVEMKLGNLIVRKKKIGIIIAIACEICQVGAVHKLRQPPEGWEGVSQMLTIANEGG